MNARAELLPVADDSPFCPGRPPPSPNANLGGVLVGTAAAPPAGPGPLSPPAADAAAGTVDEVAGDPKVNKKGGGTSSSVEPPLPPFLTLAGVPLGEGGCCCCWCCCRCCRCCCFEVTPDPSPTPVRFNEEAFNAGETRRPPRACGATDTRRPPPSGVKYADELGETLVGEKDDAEETGDEALDSEEESEGGDLSGGPEELARLPSGVDHGPGTRSFRRGWYAGAAPRPLSCGAAFFAAAPAAVAAPLRASSNQLVNPFVVVAAGVGAAGLE